MQNKPLVIYHKDCADGIAAAWCFWNMYGDTYDYHAGVYNEPPPDVFDRDVYLVDFSYSREVVEGILQYANKVVLLDHHKSALDALWDLGVKDNFDTSFATMNSSGAMIAWNYLQAKHKRNDKVPYVLQHIQDRDLWKFEMKDTRLVMMAVFSYEMTFEVYSKLMSLNKSGIKALVKEGIVLERKYKMDLYKAIEHSKRFITIGSHLVPCANVGGIYSSDAGNTMSIGQRFAATYYDSDKHRVFSLRSATDGLDVSEIAKEFGGGGHVHAAGFKVPRSHELAKV
jgi:oligoribonuclease NrnB/cAMP/cGMP phosphodiesterase (DHH superfamily)